MRREVTRRETVRRGLAATGLLGLTRTWGLPALAEGEVTCRSRICRRRWRTSTQPRSRPANSGCAENRWAADAQGSVFHYAAPRPSGDRSRDLCAEGIGAGGAAEDRSRSMNLRKMRSAELVAGFECSGNRRPLQGLASNGRWTGVPLKAVLDRVGVKAPAREFVFWARTMAVEDVDFRGSSNKVDQQFGRSLTREKAMAPELYWPTR